MYFVGTVIISIKCNNEFTGLFHNIDFGQKKIVLIKRKFLLKLHKEHKCRPSVH